MDPAAWKIILGKSNQKDPTAYHGRLFKMYLKKEFFEDPAACGSGCEFKVWKKNKKNILRRYFIEVELF